MNNTRRQVRRPSLVSLFTGAGGLDIGLELAGFETVSAVDNDPACCETLELNQQRRVPRAGGGCLLTGTKIICDSVETLRARDLHPRRRHRSWRPDLLAGGPPCQPFSSAGRQRSLDDDRGRLFEHFVRLAEELPAALHPLRERPRDRHGPRSGRGAR